MTLSTPAASPRPPAPQASACWLELDEAARRSGRWGERHLRRLCQGGWLAEGKAREVSGGGKRKRWQVREDADAAFARVKFPQQMGTDLRQVAENKRRQAIARKKILDDWWTARAGGLKLGYAETKITAQYCATLAAKGVEISRSTLFGWEKRWRSSGLSGLVDGRSNDPQPSTDNDPFLEEVQRLYLTVRKLKLTVCREIASLKAGEQGWTVRSYTTCRRHVDAIPKAVVLKLRFGEEAFVNEAQPFLKRDYSLLESNQVWCSDHHQFDVLVNWRGKLVRPWLTAWQDLRSRKILGWRIFAADPNSDSILASFRSAVMDFGVPRQVYVDNGKDFDCYALNGRTKADRWAKRTVHFELDESRAGVFPGLGIEVIHAWIYHGQSKPIERFFGTVEQWTPAWPTYCGNSPSERPEDLQLMIERGKAPTLAEFIEWFAALLETYHAGAHGGNGLEGQSPNAVYAENLRVKHTATTAALDVYCLRQTKDVKVMQNGVTYKGLKFGQFDLAERLGEQVTLKVDDNDLSSIQVWSAKGDRFLCLAKANSAIPANATSEELREAIKAKKQATKFVNEYRDIRPRLHEDLPDLMVRAKARAAKAALEESQGNGPELPPPAIKPVRSAIEDQLPAVRAALEARTFRQAVGAEFSNPQSEAGGRFLYQPSRPPAPEPESSGGRFYYPGPAGGREDGHD